MHATSLIRQRGALMIEILITIAIIIIGLLGLLELQTQLHKSEVESYQRTQALLLLDDMANRIATNRTDAASYITGTTTGLESPQGAGMTCATPGVAAPLEQRDEAEWCRALQGAAETIGGSTSVGTLVGGRGCVQPIGTGGVEEYLVSVVWQGQTPIAAPPSSVACGANLYNAPAGSSCADADKADFCRRYVTTIVRIADLSVP